MASELIVDFPLEHNHNVVQFAEIVQLYTYTVDRHEDKNELYTKADYNSMKRNIKRDFLQACESILASEEDEGS